MPTPFRLDGKTAVVTGGTKGLGCVRAAVQSALVAPLTRCAVASHRAVARHSSATSLSSSPLRLSGTHSDTLSDTVRAPPPVIVFSLDA